MNADRVVASGLLPDGILRAGIRRLVRERQAELTTGTIAERQERERAFVDRIRRAPIAVHQQAANDQHYEVPPRFFELSLGPRLKYSCGYWPEGVADLAGSEEAMLSLTCERAGIADGVSILELGCGWGSLTLYMAERYRRSRIVAISNSAPQREFILARAAARGLTNVELLTLDVSTLSFDADAPRFDRVVSVEMFEHLRNWSEMFRRIASWLREDGRFFMHVFTHREQSYVFEDIGPSDFMARHFFTGGMMPSDRLALEIQGDLIVDQHWRLDGTHYARTARAWLNAMDENERAIREVFAATYGSDARRFWNYWRAFYMACEELWSFNSGEEWLVSHYLMRRP